MNEATPGRLRARVPAGGAGAAAPEALQLAVADRGPIVMSRARARLCARTRSHGLSLADRAALAQDRGVRVLTADAAWRSLRLPVRIEVIR